MPLLNDLLDDPGQKTGTASRRLLVCFSHLRWNFVYQRPQHLLSRATRRFNVIFFEEPVRERILEPVLRTEWKQGVCVVVPVLPETMPEEDVREALRDLLDQRLGMTPADETVFWYYTPMALEFTDHLSVDAMVYDCMDELSAFRGASGRLRANEQRLFQRADLVLCGGATLYQSKRTQHRKVHLFPSSVDRAHFAKTMSSTISEAVDQRHIARPRIGYFGVIDERMDLELVDELARLRRDLQFIMLGPVVKIDPGTLPSAANIHWLGAKEYADLPNYLAGWDAGFMPFALNESTRFISPTKTPEFLSAGLPVVSTPIADVVRPYGVENLVEIAATAEDMSVALDRLLGGQTEAWRARVDAKLRAMSWDKTWSAMETLILGELRAPMAAESTNARDGILSGV